MMDWIYTAISWILLRWHDLWAAILPGTHYFLGTNWDWILAIVFLVITVRIILFPVFVKQIRSQRAMQALQPKMKALQEKHKGDSQTLREEMMKLYQSEKVNPLMGCLPMFLQIPVFLGLFHVLRRLDPFQTVNTTLYTWTQEQWDGAKKSELFTSPIWGTFFSPERDLVTAGAHGAVVKVVAGTLVLIMMITTYLTSRQMILKTGWNPDPQQRMLQKLMLYGIPASLLLSGWYFPIGVIIYWVTQNLFSLGQQYWVLHKYPPPSVAGATPMKGVKATPGNASKPAPGAKPVTGAKPVPGAKPAIGAKATGAKPAPGTKPAAKATPTKATPAKTAPTKTTPGATPPAKATQDGKPATKASPAGGTRADGKVAADGKPAASADAATKERSDATAKDAAGTGTKASSGTRPAAGPSRRVTSPADRGRASDNGASPTVGAGPTVGDGPLVGRRPSASSASSDSSSASDGTPSATAAAGGGQADSGDETESRSGSFRRQRDDAPAPAPPGGEPPAATPRVGAKPPNRNRRKGPAGKSNRKGGSKR
jgi:YidC/Oxa1 family membrane protein insertase